VSVAVPSSVPDPGLAEAAGTPEPVLSETSPRLTLVLPAHNEEALLEETVTNLLAALSGHVGARAPTARRQFVPSPLGQQRPPADAIEVIVVENGSADSTLRVALDLAARDPRVRVLALPRAEYGEALVAGFRAARGEVVVNLDVDYYDADFVLAALAELEDPRTTIVLASKRAPGAHDRRPMVRRLLTAGFTSVLRAGFHLPVSDAHGMKAMRRAELLEIVDACRMRAAMFDVEMVLRADGAGLGMAELPADVRELRPPRTPVLARTVEAVADLVKLRLLLLRERRRGSPAA
jgi:glycosyltransferase involved in cell wall biosynthesis